MKRITVVLLVLTFLLVGCDNRPVADMEEAWMPPTIQQMADCTVTVINELSCTNPNCTKEVHERWGSGVLVGDGLVLTARHLFRHETIINSYVLYQGERYLVTEILPDPDSDLALLAVEDMPAHPVAEIDLSDPPLGADVVMIGTPAHIRIGQRVVKGNVSNLHAEDLMLEVIPEGQPQREQWSRIVATTCFTVHGNSGGPVFYNGKVVGIFVGFPLVRTTLAYTYSVYVPVYELNTE